MIVGVPKETMPGERRVALTPAVVPGLIKAGAEILVELGAGQAAGFPDEAYRDKGAAMGTREEVFRRAGVLLQVRALGSNPKAGRSDLPLFGRGQVDIGFHDPLVARDELEILAERGVTCFALELLPRIARAQSMDPLSSMATVSGYKAVLLAATELPRMFPLLMTAAGTITPARVFVIGAGVAGLQAIATAHRLGAVVEAFDVRPAVKEQVQSVGGKFVDLPVETAGAEDAGGYAQAQEESFYRRQRELLTRVVAGADVIISTAAVPGKKAPVLVTADMIRQMKPGSVIVDLAAERGGNCELTRPEERVLAYGVTILGPINLPATVPYHASQMYAKNITAFLSHLWHEGELRIDLEDEITRETLIARDGRIVHPRLRVQEEART